MSVIKTLFSRSVVGKWRLCFGRVDTRYGGIHLQEPGSSTEEERQLSRRYGLYRFYKAFKSATSSSKPVDLFRDFFPYKMNTDPVSVDACLSPFHLVSRQTRQVHFRVEHCPYF